jgi:type IV secretion system protein VirD4
MEVLMRWPWSEFSKYGVPIEDMRLQSYPGLPQMDGKTRALFERHLRRGVPIARLNKDGERIHYWMSPGELMSNHRFEMGQLLVGKIGETYLGHCDDRPLTTIAGTRAGKTTTILEPNLYLYPGSMLVLDPKGELARTAWFRRLMGHNVCVLDPFGQSGEPTSSFNALDELDPLDPAIIDDVLSIANALVPDTDGGGNAKHFNNSARTLLAGLILVTLMLPKSERHLVTVRELLCLTYPPLAVKGRELAARALAKATGEEKEQYFDANNFAMLTLLEKMRQIDAPFGAVAAGIANRLSKTPLTERGSIFSTAAVHTDFIDSLLLSRTLRHSDFRLADLRGDRPTTIFLCLPVGRMEQHFRWLRLIVQLACTKLEGLGPYPRDRARILLMLEEFASLGHMAFMERASAYFPGFGVKPWFILQDITQLKKVYKAWESFLGNSGLVQLFANGDGETIDYVSRRLGKLVAPWELETGFAREHESQLLLIKGKAPAAASRLSHDDVARIRQHADAAFEPMGLPRF